VLLGHGLATSRDIGEVARASVISAGGATLSALLATCDRFTVGATEGQMLINDRVEDFWVAGWPCILYLESCICVEGWVGGTISA